MVQSVFVGHDAEACVVAVAVAENCCARGMVNVSEEARCSAEIVRSAAVAAVPVEVVTVPVIEPGPVLVPVVAIIGILPSAVPRLTPVVMVDGCTEHARKVNTATLLAVLQRDVIDHTLREFEHQLEAARARWSQNRERASGQRKGRQWASARPQSRREGFNVFLAAPCRPCGAALRRKD